MSESAEGTGARVFAESYGKNVFSLKTMRDYLSDKAYKSLRATIEKRELLDQGIADEVADAMKTWAVSHGATHFTHWFLPLTGTTAEKHDSFISPDHEGGVMLKFSGKELVQGEPDASSFPSGGLRATFEARGYTGWDPTSPAFIKKSGDGATLCIPSVFCGYHGEALDKKTPLLRSIEVLTKQVRRLGKLFGMDMEGKQVYAALGPEQEYFLIDKEMYCERLDLLQTGRTLFGRRPAKHQQMEDHYFGAIKNRVLVFMDELDRELWKLGIPAKTRHNEVCPAQFEIAPVFEEQNLAVDHNMTVMETLSEVADRHGFACLLHEKPFAGVNGSGKHNNWSICVSGDKNWLTPGDTPHDNAKFLTIICALMKAVDTYAPMLRASVACAGNDHRLGANEAPPAIMSIFLGSQLTDIINQLEQGGARSSKSAGVVEIGISSLPKLPRDVTDRNRTSPLAFTGNKFEFRAVGSSQSCAGSNVVMNTIVADALNDISRELESAVSCGKDFNETLQKVLRDIVKKHKRILFDGDNYTDDWKREAEKRGLPNLATTPESFAAIENDEATISMFERHKVLSREEFKARMEVYKGAYERTIHIEANCALTMAKTMIAPLAVEYQADLADSIFSVNEVDKDIPQKAVRTLLKDICVETERILSAISDLEEVLNSGRSCEEIISAMKVLRKPVDMLESILPHEIWPLPSYAEMMFIM
ncbi:MAG: glutamine synthetase III [Candidatus Omnitrophica bacterium]|nr:glutamine synthetase III [Candidatus Omnitrophota bacterium]MBU1128528.1 glutamine synthetase III [Candidatus Omnitrophota bacterium]MBU1784355.1 glutamine synthetase III [Candidatus Omnitrophota bacterium]MBU1851343.1 glutamine synthetase III [Candidatus Omnitrophota bacterium]